MLSVPSLCVCMWVCLSHANGVFLSLKKDTLNVHAIRHSPARALMITPHLLPPTTYSAAVRLEQAVTPSSSNLYLPSPTP
jgi:hypothetical protein